MSAERPDDALTAGIEPPRPRPLVVTLALDDASQDRLDALRRSHFPPGRNVVPAHVSLFHAVPGDYAEQVLVDVERGTRRPAFALDVGGVQRLGRGTALRVHAPELAALHAALSAAWQPWLTAQDRQPLRAHVTVQNRVSPEQARDTAQLLERTVEPWAGRALGVDLWTYLGGPWSHLRRLAFEA